MKRFMTNFNDYLSLKLLSESQEEKNPFLREVSSVNEMDKSSDHLFCTSLRLIPKIGEKSAKLIVTKFKSNFKSFQRKITQRT